MNKRFFFTLALLLSACSNPSGKKDSTSEHLKNQLNHPAVKMVIGFYKWYIDSLYGTSREYILAPKIIHDSHFHYSLDSVRYFKTLDSLNIFSSIFKKNQVHIIAECINFLK